ncbi:C6 zinc finger domain-containing protein [Colletotrichum graminicola]|nr:C6 zinc finger domain-containing protein [Colletotrichum graminicola]
MTIPNPTLSAPFYHKWQSGMTISSACFWHIQATAHRARLLGQKEPQMRIALWVQDIFPALRQALSDREQIISNTSLATAIMLASLEIISPTAFGYDIPWQRHLSLARDLMWRRLADLRRTAHRVEEDRVCAFLWSWFAYLDILGCLSGGTPDEDSSRFWLLEYMMHGASDDRYEIDCIMGFTTSCVQILAQIADLARRCDEQRLTSSTPSPPIWTPGTAFVQRAKLLEQELLYSMNEPSLPCKHIQSVGAGDRQAMVLMNEAFHWAGLIHLHRRVLSKPSGHADVQEAVRSIIVCLESIQPGGSAETGFLFPMFTAGCNALHEDQRSKILERFKSVETNGMTQARVLLHILLSFQADVWV